MSLLLNSSCYSAYYVLPILKDIGKLELFKNLPLVKIAIVAVVAVVVEGGLLIPEGVVRGLRLVAVVIPA